MVLKQACCQPEALSSLLQPSRARMEADKATRSAVARARASLLSGPVLSDTQRAPQQASAGLNRQDWDCMLCCGSSVLLRGSGVCVGVCECV